MRDRTMARLVTNAKSGADQKVLELDRGSMSTSSVSTLKTTELYFGKG